MMTLLYTVLALALNAGVAAAQTYPAKPIRMIVPLQAGSAVDNAARLVGQKMSESLGQSIVIENQAGASGVIGTERAAKAAPDGYTIGGLNDGVTTMLPHLNSKLPFDVLRDFEPISLVVTIDWGLIVGTDSAYKNAADLIAAARARPDKLNYSSGGTGSPQHVAMEVFQGQSGVRLTHVPYKGASAAALDVATGQIDAHWGAISAANALIRGGKVRLIGVAGAKRFPQYPDVPTIAESGLPGFEYSTHFAMFAPAGTSKEIINRLHAEVVKALAAPDVREKLVAQGLSIVGSTPAELAARTRSQLARYGEVFKRANIKLD